MWLGDFLPGDVIDFKFTTVNTSGVPTTLAGTPAISIYKDNGTTEDTDGVTLTVDFDSRSGLNHVNITTSSDTTFYSLESEFQAVITTGTVSGSSVVGYVVAHFSIGNRRPMGVAAGVCTTGGTTTSITTSSLVPAAGVTDQFKGRIVIFNANTSTANLRGQATDITASTSGGTLTVTALTTAPASGDTFIIV
jgi:hypothetical protein